MESYGVVFVVEGCVKDKEDDIGSLECNGFEERNEYGEHFVRDGRAYYSVEAENPVEAYYLAETMFEVDDFGKLEVTGSKLEHVELGEDYWYKEDLDKMESEMEL